MTEWTLRLEERENMPVRFQVDGDFYDHPKSIGLSDAATALWVRAGSYSTNKLLDGLVPEHVLATLSQTPEAAAEELVARGLWRRVRGGYRFHQWDHRNLTRARVEADRGYERDKKKRQRFEQRNAAHKPVDNGSEATDQQVNRTNVPTGLPQGLPRDKPGTPGNVPPVSMSVSVSTSMSGSGHALGGPEPPAKCPQHLDDPDPPNCGQCADARRRNERWHAERRRRIDTAPKCRLHRGELAHNCRMCAAERKAAS